MPIKEDEIISLLSSLAEEKKLYACANESLKGGIIAGLSAAFGGLILGPPGLAIGATVGGCIAAKMSHGKFEPVAIILLEMSSDKKTLLYNKIMQSIEKTDVLDIAQLSMRLALNLSLKELLINLLKKFITEELKLNFKN